MTNANNINTEMTTIVADILHGNEVSWFMIKLRISDNAITVIYGARSHKYNSTMKPTSFRHFSLTDTTWSAITRCVYDAMSMTAMIKEAKHAVGDETAYLIPLDGDKVLKRQFTLWRDGLRKGRPFSENVKDSR